jgi:hypothetical protein
MVRYISLLLFIGLACGAELNLDREIRMAKNDRFKNHEISLGMLDDKTGISFIGYTFNTWIQVVSATLNDSPKNT